MTSDDTKTTSQPGEIVQSSLPGERPDVIDVPQGSPENETPTDKAAKLQQESASPTELIPSDEDG